MGFGPSPRNAHEGQRLRALACVGVLVMTPLLFLGGPDWMPGPLGSSVWNLGHIAFFALLTLALRPWRWLEGWRLWLAATAVMLVAGILIEATQSQLGRDADWRDVLRNLTGVWLILAWQPLIGRPARRSASRISIAAAISFWVIIQLSATGIVAARQFELSNQLPKLYNFEHGDPSPFWLGNLEPSPNPVQGDAQSLRIELDPDTYSGASLINLPADWRQYDTLNISLFNPGPGPLPLTLRINDLTHEHGDNAHSDRFNTSFTLAPGPHALSFSLKDVRNAPRDRSIDMSQMHRLTLFASRLPAPRTVYLLDLRLD